MLQTIPMFTRTSRVNEPLAKRFQGFQLTTLVTVARRFPLASGVDVEVALDDLAQPDSRLDSWAYMLDSVTKRLALYRHLK